MEPRVLVTGATGFIGARLTRRLVETGHRVKVLVRPGSSRRGWQGIPEDQLEIAEGDITVGHTVFRALAGCDRLFHVAAEFRMWAARPEAILDASVIGTRETLDAAEARGLERIVVTSSTAAIGATAEPVEMDETFPFNREDSELYIVAKWRAEQIARERAARGVPIVIVNPSTVLGPGDFKPTPSGDLLLSYLNWKLPIKMPSSKGGFNVVDVDDVVTGHLLAMEKGRIGERYILGGTNVTFDQLFEELAQITGLPGPGRAATRGEAMVLGRVMQGWSRVTGEKPSLTYKLARDYVGAYVWVQTKKAERELGYVPRPLRATLVRAVRFFVENGYVKGSHRERIRLDLSAPPG
jgi:dihydroflavonol-4-reductase